MNYGKICVSVCARTIEKLVEDINRAQVLADLIELRFDCLAKADLTAENFERIFQHQSTVPWIITYRPKEQGGGKELTFEERTRFWSLVPRSEYADVEEDIAASGVAANKLIRSYHDFDGTAAKVDGIFARLADTDADILKIAVNVYDAVDAIPLWHLLKRAREQNKSIVPIAMGEAGKWTRILGPAHGAFLTYAALDSGSGTAPGQFSAKELKDVFRVNELDRHTQCYGVIGDPVSRSRSALIQNKAFAALGINAVFMPLLVKDLDAFMRRMVHPRSREVDPDFAGFSVTMPHKRSIIEHLDEIDPIAETIGAVNTVSIEDGKLVGRNTDAHGFITPLIARFGPVEGVKAAVFGAGGAARACVYALKEQGANVTVLTRDRERGEQFGTEFDIAVSPMTDYIGTNRRCNFDIVVNATPLGMDGLDELPLLSALQLEGLKFVYDLVTRSDDTPLIAEAKKTGVPAMGGLEMLLAQGARQFEIWTGQTAPLDVMRSAIENG